MMFRDDYARAEQYPCAACGQTVLHDRRLYETVGGTLRYAWRGRAHQQDAKHGGGFCEGGVRAPDPPSRVRLP